MKRIFGVLLIFATLLLGLPTTLFGAVSIDTEVAISDFDATHVVSVDLGELDAQASVKIDYLPDISIQGDKYNKEMGFLVLHAPIYLAHAKSYNTDLDFAKVFLPIEVGLLRESERVITNLQEYISNHYDARKREAPDISKKFFYNVKKFTTFNL